MVRNLAEIEAPIAKPAIGQIDGEPPRTVAAPSERRSNSRRSACASSTRDRSRPSDLTVIGFKMRPNRRQIDEAIDLAQEVVFRDMTLKVEAIGQRFLHHPPLAHHGVSPRLAMKSESAARHRRKRLLQQNPSTPAVASSPSAEQLNSTKLWSRGLPEGKTRSGPD